MNLQCKRKLMSGYVIRPRLNFKYISYVGKEMTEIYRSKQSLLQAVKELAECAGFNLSDFTITDQRGRTYRITFSLEEVA